MLGVTAERPAQPIARLDGDAGDLKKRVRFFIEYRCHSVSAHASKTKLRPAADRKVTLRHQEVLVRPGHPEGVFTFDVAPS